VSDLALAAAQTGYELRGYLRNARALIFTVIMPVFLLVLFNSIFHGSTHFFGLSVPAASYYTASMIAYQVMLTGFGSLLISITTNREAGLLKRYRGTPMPNWVYLAAEIGQTVVVVAVATAVLLGVGVAFNNVKVSGPMLVGLVVYVVIGTACFCALGLAASRISTTTDTASAIGPFSTVVLAFISGVFIPVAVMPRWLLDVGKIFPLEHLARGLQSAFLVHASTGITLANVGVIVVWGVVGLFVALRTFRWEPLAAGGG
jgi:ABC-2 type transport system permease protein